MARDDEFRKVAEDIGALARSLGRDFREAVDQAVRGGHPPGRAVRHGLRGLTDEARRGLRTGWSGPHGRRRGRSWVPRGYGYGGPQRGIWAPPRHPGAPPLGGPGSPATDFADPPAGPAAPPWTQGRPWTTPQWNGPQRNSPRRRRHSLPPVRHRWDATTVAGLLAVLFGVAWLIGATGALHVSIEGVVAVGLMLLGASLVVTGRTDWSLSRRSWPVWAGAAMIAVLVATSTTFGLGGALDSVSFGNKTVIAEGRALPAGTVHGGFGDLTVDLSNVTKQGSLKIVSVAGRIIVDVPQNAAVSINARVFGGEICVNGKHAADGIGAQNRQTFGRGPRLNLDVHQVFGQILIGTSGDTGCAGR